MKTDYYKCDIGFLVLLHDVLNCYSKLAERVWRERMVRLNVGMVYESCEMCEECDHHP